MLKRFTKPKDDDFSLEINFDEKPQQGMSAVDYHDILVKNNKYVCLYKQSGLTETMWLYAMNITAGRHSTYVRGMVVVPNSILNKAAIVSKKIIRNCRALHEV